MQYPKDLTAAALSANVCDRNHSTYHFIEAVRVCDGIVALILFFYFFSPQTDDLSELCISDVMWFWSWFSSHNSSRARGSRHDILLFIYFGACKGLPWLAGRFDCGIRDNAAWEQRFNSGVDMVQFKGRIYDFYSFSHGVRFQVKSHTVWVGTTFECTFWPLNMYSMYDSV